MGEGSHVNTDITSHPACELGLAGFVSMATDVVVAGAEMARSEVTASCGLDPCSLVGSISANLEPLSGSCDSCDNKKTEQEQAARHSLFNPFLKCTLK